MAYPGRHLKLTFGGKSTKDDVWSNSFSLLDNSGDGQDQGGFGGSVDLAQVFNTIKDLFVTNTFGLEKYCTLDYVKIAQIGTDGRYIGDARVYTNPTPVPGIATMGRAPQDSLVVTLDSGDRSGVARKGRIYLPAGFVSIDPGTGRVPANEADLIAHRVIQIINSLNSITVNGHKASVIIASATGAGAFKPVVSVYAGDVIDTQRRRRNRVSEKYTAKIAVQ